MSFYTMVTRYKPYTAPVKEEATYAIKLGDVTGDGTVSAKVGGADATSATEGAEVTVTATPKAGETATVTVKNEDGWAITLTGTNPEAAGDPTVVTFTMPAGAATISVKFAS